MATGILPDQDKHFQKEFLNVSLVVYAPLVCLFLTLGFNFSTGYLSGRHWFFYTQPSNIFLQL